jgi:Peptidase family S41
MIAVFIVLSGATFASSLDGVWKSQGYGYVFEITDKALKGFEVTTRTCVAGFEAKRDSNSEPGREATFRTGDGDVYFVRQGDTLDHRRLHSEGSASDIWIDRLPSMPSVCRSLTRDTPQDNFEVFTRTWAENYISFDLKHANWEQSVAESRTKVTSHTAPAELFEIFKAMIQPFGDMHTFIGAPKLKPQFHGLRPGTDRVVIDTVGAPDFRRFRKGGISKLWAVTDERYLRDRPLRQLCNAQLQYGHIDGTTGYLRILSFSGYSKEGGFSRGLDTLETALDEIFSDPMLRALVIDVRVNFGGDDPYGLEIASRLATTEYLAYAKQARADPVDHNKWTRADPSIVKSSSRPGFRGPVVELTGPLTISAGETFTQALMGRVPHVTRIGENTQGVFSDVLDRRLPNGWTFGLPNEVYRNAEGVAFDGTGIPPDISRPVFADADVAARKDPALMKAIEVLKTQ